MPAKHYSPWSLCVDESAWLSCFTVLEFALSALFKRQLFASSLTVWTSGSEELSQPLHAQSDAAWRTGVNTMREIVQSQNWLFNHVCKISEYQHVNLDWLQRSLGLPVILRTQALPVSSQINGFRPTLHWAFTLSLKEPHTGNWFRFLLQTTYSNLNNAHCFKLSNSFWSYRRSSLLKKILRRSTFSLEKQPIAWTTRLQIIM